MNSGLREAFKIGISIYESSGMRVDGETDGYCIVEAIL